MAAVSPWSDKLLPAPAAPFPSAPVQDASLFTVTVSILATSHSFLVPSSAFPCLGKLDTVEAENGAESALILNTVARIMLSNDFTEDSE